MDTKTLSKVIRILREEYKRFIPPIVTRISLTGKPYLVLVSTIISLRTKDKTTAEASKRLFNLAKTPKKMVSFKEETISEAIYPAGFYRNKARDIKRISQIILDEHKGKVPNTIEELIKLPGVGRKTANLVVTLGFNKPGICVDIHVYRIMNRFGYVKTKTPDETEQVLREKLPKKYWIEINDLLVSYGQNICKPVSPYCSECKIRKYCPRIGVEKSR